MVSKIVWITAGIAFLTIFFYEAGKLQPGAEIKYHVLKWPNVPVRFYHGMSDGVRGPVGIRYGAVQHGDTVVALQIRRVWQN